MKVNIIQLLIQEEIKTVQHLRQNILAIQARVKYNQHL